MPNNQWWGEISNFLKQFGRPPTEEEVKQHAPAFPGMLRPTPPGVERPKSTSRSIVDSIGKAALEHKVLLLQYKGLWRYVEPYQFKTYKTGNFCLMAYSYAGNRTKAFSVGKIQDAQVTESIFLPRWEVKIK